MKEYHIVSKDNDKIIASRNIGKYGQSIYSRNPKERTSFILEGVVLAVGLLGILLSVVNVIPSLRLKIPPILALVLAASFVVIAYSAVLRDRFVTSTDNKKKRRLYNGYTPSVGSWRDPYGLARDTADVRGKKTYYIIDSETNAIVDVKRLGKWGQAYIEWRGKRQKRDKKEGGA